MTLADAAGWVGAACLLAAYAGVASGRLTSAELPYRWANVVGSAGLAVASAAHGAWPSVALNAVWLVVAAVTWRIRPPVGATAR